ncbi:MocR-like pyridoxine biosynthesis transcription factor PdxR [Massilia endophytica]|uniref:MocR-like pyridoxine biosynthesis transcription factor PdxR n=1 Tax=Massilia endophytica TaxID=2899220 RepID=UPI001E64FEDE|nr:PLP-dependent aminotransferase family protein [Massilia endophytica]UGQ46234.1 PLP-dependent aminotransferase family protein [Massilia endophytica]
MEPGIHINLDRGRGESLTEQITSAMAAAIREGRLLPGARLPSWRDLAAQLGVARGTVRMAYENLRDQQLVWTAGAAGTYVAKHIAAVPPSARTIHDGEPAAGSPSPSAIFRIGVPAQDVFPFKTWSRIMGRAARAASAMPLAYPDPQGETALRAEIAAYLCMARGMQCTPQQIFITHGFAGGLELALKVLGMARSSAWMEEPGFSLTRQMLEKSGVSPIPVPVDAEGLNVEAGIALAPHAALAVVTAGQQAPTGVTLSLARRHALLEWAARSDAWIVEDDYLGELQLQGRATPALASLDRNGRVLHIGTFSKTINPGLRVGYLVAPPQLAPQVASMAGTFTSAPAPAIQLAVAEFMHDGHYLRHLRRMKRLYADRRRALGDCLASMSIPHVEAGLAVLIRLPDGVNDAEAAARARTAGMAPSALSWWHANPFPGYGGLLLGVTNLAVENVSAYCQRLQDVLKSF